MSDAEVYTKKVAGAATHAIVIGVGHYPYLPGGSGKTKFSKSAGLGQLKSPPVSARRIARWLIEDYENVEKPLASVSLLLSDKTSQDFEYEKDGKKKTEKAPVANIAEVTTAVREWFKKGNTNSDNLLLFFFCGHGIAGGIELALLLADFGQVDIAPLDGAINSRVFRQNMDTCAARQQCYFLDACRVASDLLIRNVASPGVPIIQNVGMNATNRIRQWPTFYSTLSDAAAYAKPGKPSLFTQALLEGLAGAGCEEDQGLWSVQTTLLHHALSKIMRDLSERLGMPQAQINPADEMSTFALNTVAVPQIPVVVSCRPPNANSFATLTYSNGATQDKRRPDKATWRVSLPIGEYDFAADFKVATYKRAQLKKNIFPTFPYITLDVKP